MANLLPHERWAAITQSNAVKAKCLARANKIAANARNLAASENVDAKITVTTGVRPDGRGYARVSASASTEHGTSWTRRSRILGRTIGGETAK
jgi:hypothetical protein